jgi:hypothetical protein
MSHLNDHSSALALISLDSRLGASETRDELVFSMSFHSLIKVFLCCVLGFYILFLTVVGHIAIGLRSILVFGCFLVKIWNTSTICPSKLA